MHPIAQRLPIHAAQIRSRGAGVPIHHEGQSQHSTSRIGVLGPRGRMPKPSSVQVLPGNRHACRHDNPRESMRDPENHNCRRVGILNESDPDASGINPTEVKQSCRALDELLHR